MRAVFFIILFLLHFVSILPLSAQEKKYQFSSNKMGSPFHLVFVDQDSSHASKIAQHAFELVDSLVKIFSDYDSSSELCALSAKSGDGPIPVSKGLLEILLKSQDAFNRSQHSFDISMGPLSVLWRNARKTKSFPDSSLVS